MRPVSILTLRAAAAITATDTGAAVDVSKFTGNGYVLLNSSAAGAAGNTSDVKLQHSDDGSTNWTDSGIVFAQVTNAAASHQAQYISLDQFKKFVRVVNTLAGTTPTVTAGVEMIGEQHQG
jgi:hypothetical protein